MKATQPINRVEQTQLRIVDSARRLFSERGYQGTSTDAIAADIPVSKRTLYNHFESKEVLFQAVISNSWSWLLSSASMDLETAEPTNYAAAARSLKKYGKAVLKHWRGDGVVELIRLVIAEAHRFPEIADAYLQNAKSPAVDRLADFLARANSHGAAEIRHPAIAAWQFHGMLKETVFLPSALGLKPLFPEAKVIQSAVDATLRKPPGGGRRS